MSDGLHSSRDCHSDAMSATRHSCYRVTTTAQILSANNFRYCIRTKGKLAELDKPGACGKGQVYLEGAVAILRSVDTIDFHLLYSGKVRTPPPP